MQTAFLTKQQELYGGWTLHHYSVDLYNEMHPSTTDPAYMRANSSAVMQSLKAVDPQAVWVMQAWCLRNNPEDWPPEAVEGFLKGVSDDEMVCDLRDHGLTGQADPGPGIGAHALLEQE